MKFLCKCLYETVFEMWDWKKLIFKIDTISICNSEYIWVSKYYTNVINPTISLRDLLLWE